MEFPKAAARVWPARCTESPAGGACLVEGTRVVEQVLHDELRHRGLDAQVVVAVPEEQRVPEGAWLADQVGEQLPPAQRRQQVIHVPADRAILQSRSSYVHAAGGATQAFWLQNAADVTQLCPMSLADIGPLVLIR